MADMRCGYWWIDEHDSMHICNATGDGYYLTFGDGTRLYACARHKGYLTRRARANLVPPPDEWWTAHNGQRGYGYSLGKVRPPGVASAIVGG